MSTRYLLDVNVWIALFDDAHSHTHIANEFVAKRGLKIATCPLVENAVVRVMNLPNYGRMGAVGFSVVRDQLLLACDKLDHQFWADDISLRDQARFDFAKLHGHNQITDAYLLALAVAHKGALVTFDQRIVLSSVIGATAKHLIVLE